MKTNKTVLSEQLLCHENMTSELRLMKIWPLSGTGILQEIGLVFIREVIRGKKGKKYFSQL